VNLVHEQFRGTPCPLTVAGNLAASIEMDFPWLEANLLSSLMCFAATAILQQLLPNQLLRCRAPVVEVSLEHQQAAAGQLSVQRRSKLQHTVAASTHAGTAAAAASAVSSYSSLC
jgi:hypothetical protein